MFESSDVERQHFPHLIRRVVPAHRRAVVFHARGYCAVHLRRREQSARGRYYTLSDMGTKNHDSDATTIERTFVRSQKGLGEQQMGRQFEANKSSVDNNSNKVHAKQTSLNELLRQALTIHRQRTDHAEHRGTR